MRPRRANRLTLRPLAALLAAAGFASCALAQSQIQPPPPAALPPAPGSTPDRLMPLEVTINSVQNGNWTLLERNGVLYAPEDAFAEWRVRRRADAQPVDYRGQKWYPLGAVPGFEARMNFANQSVDLVFSPQAFAATHVNTEAAARLPVTPAEPALFLNYDANLSQTRVRGAGATRELGALLEAGYSSRLGVLTSSHVVRNLASGDPELPRSVRRLETTFTRDFPDSNLTLRLGDSTTRAGMWGRPVYFGGLQLSRNFGLSPGFVTQPIPVISGTSSAPSTVELYINDALRQTSTVPTGPFVIDNFPLLTGAGQARLVVRDVLGRETVVVQPFFSHATLLDKGLSDWSVEAGATRLNLGLDNANYGEGFTSGMVRYGVTTGLTLEGRAELTRTTRNAGLGLTAALPLGLLGQAAVAASSDPVAGRGHEWLAGLEYDSLRHGFTLHAEGASRNYRQIGLEAGTLRNRLEVSASYSFTSERFGAIGLGMARIATYDRGTLTSYSANYSVKVGDRSSLTLTATRVTGPSSATSFGASLTVPLENQVNVSSNFSHRGSQNDAYTSVSKGLSEETGLGWRALAGVRNQAAYSEGGLYYQGNRALFTADASASKDLQALRLGAQGGMVFMDGRFFLSRRVQESFALVEVPGYANVGVGFQGKPLTRTNQDGVALLPRLLPYQANSIRLDPTELPINAELDSIELVAVPPMRSGVKVVFPVRTGRGALIKLLLEDGEPAPAGAEVELVGDKKEFFVARRGEAFITGLQPKNTIRLKWKDASCDVQIELPPGNPEDIARIGPLTCKGVRR